MSEKKTTDQAASEQAAAVPVEATPPPAKNPNQATVKLETPLKRGDQEITVITLRKPAAGELRGLKLQEVLQMDVGSLHTLLPRITSPTLTPHDVSQLDLADLVQLASEVAGFFLTKAERESLNA